ncbi:ABC transporter permease [Corynebacterium guangdongense]|uniref:ABC transport system permease protein n=1 Tax=Corynebacterium guangdongense TaxID=1783348 RepID=A0ABU1ZV70_9CORY|nr:FtsX-like permease family protein [Corynebacterium guangdongense]MDR7328816.1 putative ABC transport system permease protein [Corynebacterium guangdongense]WJZ17391.1 FtsX-like permease family protein [Corynebacterium guangdongense]
MSSLAAAVRPTRRDAIRHPQRILVAVLLIALPVAVLSFQWLWTDSAQFSTRVPGSQATVSVDYAACVEPERPGGAFRRPVDCPSGEDVAAALPSQFESHFFVDHLYGMVSGRNFTADVSAVQLPTEALPEDFSPPVGHAPGPGEVMVPTRLRREYGVTVGDPVRIMLGQEPIELTVSGFTPGETALATGTTLVAPEEDPAVVGGIMQWQISGPRPLTEEDARRLEEAGFTVQSAQLPGRRSPDPSYLGSMSPGQLLSFTAGRVSVLLIGLFILVLIMSPVFTIAAARQTRNYALMRAQGAAPKHIWWAVLAYGAIAGVLGATTGVVLGAGAAAITWRVVFTGWPFTVLWATLAMLWVVTVGISVLSASLPADRVERSTAAAGMSGAETDRITGWRKTMATGPVVLVTVAVGWLVARVVARAVVGSDDRLIYFPFFNPAYPVLVLIIVVALAASVPAVLLLVSRLTDRAGLAWRMAGRDARRRALTSTAAIAAIVVVVFLASASLVTLRTMEARTRAEAESVHPLNLVTVQHLPMGRPYDGKPSVATEAGLNRAMDSLASSVPTSTVVAIEEVVFGEPATAGDVAPGYGQGAYFEDQSVCRDRYPGPGGDSTRRLLDDPELSATCLAYLRSYTAHSPLAMSGGPLVASERLLDLFTWSDPRAHALAVAALNRPAVIVSRDHESLGSPRPLKVVRSVGESSEGPEEETTLLTDVAVVPALPEGYNGPMLITAPLVAQFGAQTRLSGFAALTTETPSSAERDRAQRAVSVGDPNYSLFFNTQSSAPRAFYWQVAGILALGAFAIVSLISALGSVRDRRRYDQLAALGAAPGTAARIAAASAWLLAFVGAGTGLLAGHLAAVAMLRTPVSTVNGDLVLRGDFVYLRVEWAEVVALLLVVPLLAGAFFALLHLRSGRAENVAQRDD